MAHFDLSARQLTALDCTTLPESIRSLDLSNNCLASLPDMSPLGSLGEMDLSYNSFTDAESVLPGLRTLPHLFALKIDLPPAQLRLLVAALPNLQFLNGSKTHISDYHDKVNSLLLQTQALRLPKKTLDDRVEARLFELTADLEMKEEAAAADMYQRRALVVTKRAFLTCLKDSVRTLVSEEIQRLYAQIDSLENQLFLELADLAPTRPTSIVNSPRKIEETDSVEMENEPEISEVSPRQVSAQHGDLRLDNVALKARVEGLEADIVSLLSTVKEKNEEEIRLKQEVVELRHKQSLLEEELQGFKELFERDKSQETSDHNTEPRVPSKRSPLYRSISRDRARLSQARSLRHSTLTEGRVLSRKALLSCIAEVYESKARSDQRNWDNRLPRETLAEHLQHYLCTKYGLKTLRDRWEMALFAALGTYSQDDCDVELFAKLLRSQLDEGYRLVHESFKARAVGAIMDTTSRRKRRASDSLTESEAYEVISTLFPAEDRSILLEVLKALGQQLVLRRDMPVTRPGSHKYSAGVVLHVLLKYRLQQHCDRLSGFLAAFQQHDSNGDGRLTQNELRELLRSAGLEEDQVLSLLRAIDPANLQVATLSECAAALNERRGGLQLWDQ